MKYIFLFSLLLNTVYSYTTIASLLPNKNFNNFNSRRNLLYTSLGGISIFELANAKKASAYTVGNNQKNVNNILYYIEQEQEKIYNNSIPSVCYISTEYTSIASNFNLNKEDLPKGVGTGFIWDKKGHIITNFHVINKVDNALVTITTNNNEKITYSAKLTGVDPDTDLAVLKIDAPEKHLQTINYNKDVVKTRVGQFAFAIGNPFGQDHTITSGIISANNRELAAPTGRKIYNVIQTDAAINPGNSGGPLLNSKGELIGINTASLGMGVSSGIGFTIPIQNALKSITEIIDTGFVERAIIGISYMERNPTELESEKTGIPIIDKGILILEVPKDSPAELSGLKGMRFNNETKKVDGLGDIIIKINNDDINNPNDLNKILKKYKPDDIVDLKYIRDNKEEITKLKLGKYKGTTFTKLESEKKLDDDVRKIDIPLKDLEPKIEPKLN
jgi:S1-C subfamily serine protease|uniref:PDZ domain-containing protein n=1 Tax=viral metagenome TaxID=1070528 RepID=A0A6C0JNL9_9ZZZZ